MFGRQRAVGADRGKLALGLLHRVDGLRQHLGNLGKGRIALDELAVQAREQPFELFAQP